MRQTAEADKARTDIRDALREHEQVFFKQGEGPAVGYAAEVGSLWAVIQDVGESSPEAASLLIASLNRSTELFS